MGHSYVNCLIHLIFSTKHRQKHLSPELQKRLWPFLGGIARAKGMKALAVGGADDHVHLLLSLPPTISISKAAQEIKGVSSRWIHETFPAQKNFSWQEGYGAFSIGISRLERTVAYIQGQRQHHGQKTFKEELLTFLKAHGMEYDEKIFEAQE